MNNYKGAVQYIWGKCLRCKIAWGKSCLRWGKTRNAAKKNFTSWTNKVLIWKFDLRPSRMKLMQRLQFCSTRRSIPPNTVWRLHLNGAQLKARKRTLESLKDHTPKRALNLTWYAGLVDSWRSNYVGWKMRKQIFFQWTFINVCSWNRSKDSQRKFSVSRAWNLGPNWPLISA